MIAWVKLTALEDIENSISSEKSSTKGTQESSSRQCLPSKLKARPKKTSYKNECTSWTSFWWKSAEPNTWRWPPNFKFSCDHQVKSTSHSNLFDAQPLTESLPTISSTSTSHLQTKRKESSESTIKTLMTLSRSRRRCWCISDSLTPISLSSLGPSRLSLAATKSSLACSQPTRRSPHVVKSCWETTIEYKLCQVKPILTLRIALIS